jgi:4-amino-4-deoxy-L-arabinose transferase-like glycosyltransferase
MINRQRTLVWLAIVGILLLAAFFRLYRLCTMPRGLSQDETVNADISLGVLKSRRGVPFLAEGFGHEPLFHYLQGITIALFGDNTIGIRMPAVSAGMMLVAVAYVMMRRCLGTTAALTAAGGMAVSWWPIIFSRVGVRAITFPLLLTLAVLLLWEGLKKQRHLPVILSGLYFGLTFYTYTSARILPALALAWLCYAMLFHPRQLRHHWRALLGVVLIASIIAVPLVLYLNAHPELQERVEQLEGPLKELRRGNLGPIWRASLATLGMFSSSGESRWTYGIPGRPIFGPLTGLLFYLGVLRCAVQLRRPIHGILGLWLLVGLTPSMVTPDPPSSIRAIGALPAAYGLVGLGAGWLWKWIQNQERSMRSVFFIALSLIGLLHGGWTYRDGFIRWATHEETYWRYKTHFADIAAYLDNQLRPKPSVVIEPWIEPVDLDGVRRNLIHDERQPRWSRGGLTFIWPSEAERFVLALPIFSTVHNEMWKRFAGDPTAIAVSTYHMPDGRPGVTFYEISSDPILHNALAQASQAPLMLPQSQQVVQTPLNLGDQIAFLGYKTLDIANEELRIITFWRALRDSPEAFHLFVHLLNADGELAAQHDGFDAWIQSLHRGDVVAQWHSLPLADVPDGRYQLQAGAYTLSDKTRLSIMMEDEAITDRLWLNTVEVEP